MGDAAGAPPGLPVQQRVHRRHVSRLQLAGGQAQLEAAQDHVVPGLGQVSAGLEELGLGVEHVQVHAHTHLVAQLRGFQGQLG